MSNMSYCRFENTSGDFADCLNAIDEAFEDGIPAQKFINELSDTERRSFRRLYLQAKRLVELVQDEIGAI